MNQILYNKEWSEKTVQQIQQEQRVCIALIEKLQYLQRLSLTEFGCVDAMLQNCRRLEASLEVTWTVLEQYSEDMQRVNRRILESIEEADAKAKKVFA